MCERYDFLDKLVLHDMPDAGVRIRLHLYRDGYYDRPHNHRWSFASRIICGQYGHRIFGTDDAFTEDTDPATLRPLCERTETPGSTYALHHASVHTVQASGGTISLLIRGPAAKDRFLILDRADGGSFWAYGAASETPQQRAAKTTTPAILHDQSPEPAPWPAWTPRRGRCPHDGRGHTGNALRHGRGPRHSGR